MRRAAALALVCAAAHVGDASAEVRDDLACEVSSIAPLPSEPPEDGRAHASRAYDGTVLVYLNRLTTTYRREGANDEDSRANVSSRLPEGAASLTIPGWSTDGATWDATLECLEEVLGPYDVEVTASDPGWTDHVEVHLGGHPGDLALGGNVAGVAAMDTKDCSVVENPIAYVFPAVLGDDPRRVCETIAHEIAHGFGIDHVLDCEDPMSYQRCAERVFRYRENACGEGTPRPCHCEKRSHNPARTLLETIGPGERPALWLENLEDGDQIGPELELSIVLNREPIALRITVDGEPLAAGAPTMRPGHLRYHVRPRTSLRPGFHEVTVSAAYPRGDVTETVVLEVPALGDDVYSSGAGGTVLGGCASGGTRRGGWILVAALALALRRERMRTG